jgi:hypothetical protein
MPDFRGAPKILRYRKADIRPIFEDGTDASVTVQQFLSELPQPHGQLVLQRVFRGDRKRGRRFVFRVAERFPFLNLPRETTREELERETRNWIRARMDQLFSGKRVMRVEFVWRLVDADLTARPVVRTVEPEQLYEVILAED